MQNTDSQKDFVICILNNWWNLQHGLLASRVLTTFTAINHR